MVTRPATGVICSAMVLLLAACENSQPDVEERIRAIKTITIAERAGGQARTFSGKVQAVDTSKLSFEIAGNISELTANVGDLVQKGEVLASLDTSKVDLGVESAKALVERARAILVEKKADYERQQALFERDIVSKAAVEKAEAAADSAESSLNYAQSQLNLSLRDVRQTKLHAPFQGVIAERHVERHQEVVRAQAVYTVYNAEKMEVLINVPETQINALHTELPAEIVFPSAEIEPLQGTVSEISTSAGAGNAYPVKISLPASTKDLLPGMTASATLILAKGPGQDAFVVPLGALVPGAKEGEGFIFRYDPTSSTVQKIKVSGEGAREDLVVLTEGVAAGDIIAVAGTSFLRDGQKVKLMEQ